MAGEIRKIAKLFVHRANELGFKGRKRDDLAVEFFLGAAAGLHMLAGGDGNSSAGKAYTHAMAVTSMLVCTRGFRAVVELAEDPPNNEVTAVFKDEAHHFDSKE